MTAREVKRERPRQPGKIRSIILALAVHLAFFALIFIGVSWQSQPTPPLQAELWDKLPTGAPVEKAAPAKATPPPEPAKPEPVKPEPPQVQPKPEPPPPDPAIAERKERERKQQELREQELREQARKERDRKEQERKDRDAKAAAEAKAKAAAEAKAKAAAEEKAKAEAEAQAMAAAQAAAQARQSEIDRYKARIQAKIRSKANVPDTVRGLPEVQVRITILPGGEVLDIVIVKSSGNPVYDSAIERAVRSAQPLPVPSDPELFARFRSLNLNVQHER